MDILYLCFCFLLDQILGDPHKWPHPVCLIGWLLNRLESLSRSLPLPLKFSGFISLLLACSFSAALVYALTSLPWLGTLFTIYLGYTGLALGSLLTEGKKLVLLIENQDLPAARKALSMLVSRDTSTLDMQGVMRSLGETLAENFNDGFVCPLFYLAIGAPIGMWVYKTISTMDSMWGYTTPRWKELGFFGAKTDDLMAWIPARISALCLWLAGKILGYNSSLVLISKDAVKTASPNAGWPMSAAAHILKKNMGGPTVYFGKLINKPTLGPDQGNKWEIKDLHCLLRLLFLGSILCLLTLSIVILIFGG